MKTYKLWIYLEQLSPHINLYKIDIRLKLLRINTNVLIRSNKFKFSKHSKQNIQAVFRDKTKKKGDHILELKGIQFKFGFVWNVISGSNIKCICSVDDILVDDVSVIDKKTSKFIFPKTI